MVSNLLGGTAVHRDTVLGFRVGLPPAPHAPEEANIGARDILLGIIYSMFTSLYIFTHDISVPECKFAAYTYTIRKVFVEMMLVNMYVCMYVCMYRRTT